MPTLAAARAGKRVLLANKEALVMAGPLFMAAVGAGVRQVECTINGIGERAGNASLEELVMAIRTREGILGVHTGIDTKRLFPTSRLLSSITGMTRPYMKPSWWAIGDGIWITSSAPRCGTAGSSSA